MGQATLPGLLEALLPSCLFTFSLLIRSTVLVTGAAGFISFPLSTRPLKRYASGGARRREPFLRLGAQVKRARIAQLMATAECKVDNFKLIKASLEDRVAVEAPCFIQTL